MLKRLIHTAFFLPIVFLCSAQEVSPYKISRLSFNSGIFSEISPVIHNDGIIFCSDRRFSAVKDRKTFEGRRIYNLYYAERTDSADWDKPYDIRSERSMLFNSGPLSIAPDGKTVYFTSDVETGRITKKRKFRNRSGIFIAELSGTNLTSMRPFAYNNQEYDVGQPSVSRDGRYLFFASNMPGGFGGADLYYCEWLNGQWSSPVNLGPGVNSSGSENFPFMHLSGRLYFSSDRPGGKGGMDVYYTSIRMGEWDEPSAMPEPVNSADDDFAFVADDNMSEGYFASNRMKNDDIYRFESTIIRKAFCDTLIENSYCYQMIEENALLYDTIPFRYEWTFGDGSPKGIGADVIHCYEGPGSYLIQLDAVNLITNEVLFNQKTYRLDVVDEEQPYIEGPDSAYEGQKIRFDAGSTNLPGWNITRFYWNFGDESIAIGKEVDKVYNRPGTYNIQLIVTADPEPGAVIREACVCKNIIIMRQP
jgi:Tol biopolymer transport system component